MFSTTSIIAWGIISFIVGALLIKTSRFTKVRDVSGVMIYKDKQTGKEYIMINGGFMKEI